MPSTGHQWMNQKKRNKDFSDYYALVQFYFLDRPTVLALIFNLHKFQTKHSMCFQLFKQNLSRVQSGNLPS